MKSLRNCMKRGLSALLTGALCLGMGAGALAAPADAVEQKTASAADIETGKTYTVSVEMYKVNKKDKSMADGAIEHTITLEKDANGAYWATIEFTGLSIYNQYGYLSSLKYYDAGYTYDEYDDPQGTTTAATVLSYQTDSTGANIVDQYNDKNNPYPKTLKFQLVDGASTGEYVPLQVFVPIMEKISEGSGTQNVLMKIDWSTLAEQKTTFTDVQDSSAYYYNAVYWAVDKNITTGMGEGTFMPANVCTRAQVVTFLWRANNEPAASITGTPFTDIDTSSTSWYYKALLWAYEKGIVNGMTPTTFEPNGEVTRAQFVTMLNRSMGSPKASAASNPFSDVSASTGSWYYDAVLWAVEKGVTTGTSETTFSPNQTCKREQVVTFLYRALKDA